MLRLAPRGKAVDLTPARPSRTSKTWESFLYAVPLDHVEHRIAGRLPIPLPKFNAALGRPARKVWHRLRELRERDGTCRASVAEIAKGTSMCAAYVERGLKRLRQLRLVTRAKGKPNSPAKRVRIVYGTPGQGKTGEVALVPHEAWREINQAKSWGGLRDTAGRPKGRSVTNDNSFSEVGVMTDEKIQVAESEIKWPKTDGIGIKRPIAEVKSSGRKPQLQAPLKGGLEPAVPNPRAGVRASARACKVISLESRVVVHSSFQEEEQRGAVPARANRVSFSEDTDSTLGTRLGGGATVPAIDWQLPGVPDVPPKSVSPAKRPQPPEIDPEWPPDAQVLFLAATWEHAVEHRWPRDRSWTFKGKNYPSPGTDKFDELLTACQALQAHNIAPAQWLHFCFELWSTITSDERKEISGKKISKKKRAPRKPPARWCFQPGLIDKHRGWFRREFAPQVLGGNIIPTPAYAELTERHARMRYVISTTHPTQQVQLDHILDRFFPDDLYDELVATAQAEAYDLQRELNKQAFNGEWIW